MDGTSTGHHHESSTGSLVPVALPVTIRTSVTHYALGNIAMAALLYALVTKQLDIWVCATIALVFAVALTLLSSHRAMRNSERYLVQRLAELTPTLGDGGEALKLARQDRSSALRVSALNPVLALPGLVAAVWIAVVTFNAAEAALDDWYWAARLPTAFLAAAAFFAVLLVLWAAVNYSPAYARFNLAKLRLEHDDANAQHEVATRLSAEDHNDIQIINQQAHLDSLHRRVETYTLESALLSALSFSSFLTIAMAESADGRGFIAQLSDLAGARLEWREQPFVLPLPGDIVINRVPVLPEGFLQTHNVALIALALLLCATTFLGVLVARLRFNDGYREADSVLKAADRLNDKQERLLHSGGPPKQDHVYGEAIATMLDKSAQLQRGLDLMLTYMRLSRSAGILCFIAALGLCGLLFNWMVTVVIFMVMGCAWIVGYIDALVRGVRRRDVFNKRGVGLLLKPFRRRLREPA